MFDNEGEDKAHPSRFAREVKREDLRSFVHKYTCIQTPQPAFYKWKLNTLIIGW